MRITEDLLFMPHFFKLPVEHKSIAKLFVLKLMSDKIYAYVEV